MNKRRLWLTGALLALLAACKEKLRQLGWGGGSAR
jgi:hypothetical protein